MKFNNYSKHELIKYIRTHNLFVSQCTRKDTLIAIAEKLERQDVLISKMALESAYAIQSPPSKESEIAFTIKFVASLTTSFIVGATIAAFILIQ